MHLLYCDESNLEERQGDFFTYAGLAFDGAKAKDLSETIDKLRSEAKVPRGFQLKFNPKPEQLSHEQFKALKQSIIEVAIAHGAILLVYVVLHDIAKDPDAARLYGINTICYHFDCLLHRVKQSGLVLIDRFTDRQIDAHLVEKFSIGVNLPYSKEYRLTNVVGLHYSAVGQSHLSSLIDIILGSLRFSINAFTRQDKERIRSAGNLLQLIAPLFLRDEKGGPVSEISFFFSPKSVTIDEYRNHYHSLQRFLAENGIATAQEITAEKRQ